MYDVVVVGGGQAGLALGRELADRSLDFLIVDAGAGPGASWRARWNSLRLFTPAAYSALPGLPFPAPPETLPTKDQVADYLATYYAHFALPVRWRTPVGCLASGGERPGDDGYTLHTPDGVLRARQVVVATGAFQRPWLPSVAGQLGDGVCQVHSDRYRSPGQLPDGPVLVVGAGNSGVQIADELARNRSVTLAIGSRHPYLPQRLLGRSIFWWGERLGLDQIKARSPLGRFLRPRGEPLVGDRPRRLHRSRDVALTGHIVSAEGGELRAAEGAVLRPRSVVWATGHVPDFTWIDLPVVGADGWIRHREGRAALPGLYTLGLPWQRTQASALLGWVGRDAADLAEIIARRARAFGARGIGSQELR